MNEFCLIHTDEWHRSFIKTRFDNVLQSGKVTFNIIYWVSYTIYKYTVNSNICERHNNVKATLTKPINKPEVRTDDVTAGL